MKESKGLPQEEPPVRGKLITIDEAVQYTRIGKTTLYDMMKKTEIRAFPHKRGKACFDTADLDDYLRKCAIPSGTMPGNV